MGNGTRVNARQATLAVLKVLQERTDETKPIHIPEIVEELKKPPYEISTNRDTVKRILDDLRLDQFYPEVQCETLRRGWNQSMTARSPRSAPIAARWPTGCWGTSSS